MSTGFGDTSSQANTTTTTTNVDRRVTTDSGDILALGEGGVNVNQGGALTLVQNDPAAALAAIATIKDQGQAIADAAVQLAGGSNAIATTVAKSQEQFVATATGQKTVLYILAGLAAIVIVPVVVRMFQKP